MAPLRPQAALYHAPISLYTHSTSARHARCQHCSVFRTINDIFDIYDIFEYMCSSWCTQEFDAALELIDQHLKSGVAEYPLYVKALIRRQRGAAAGAFVCWYV